MAHARYMVALTGTAPLLVMTLPGSMRRGALGAGIRRLVPVAALIALGAASYMVGLLCPEAIFGALGGS
jgi:hypothetical protein